MPLFTLSSHSITLRHVTNRLAQRYHHLVSDHFVHFPLCTDPVANQRGLLTQCMLCLSWVQLYPSGNSVWISHSVLGSLLMSSRTTLGLYVGSLLHVFTATVLDLRHVGPHLLSWLIFDCLVHSCWISLLSFTYLLKLLYKFSYHEYNYVLTMIIWHCVPAYSNMWHLVSIHF